MERTRTTAIVSLGTREGEAWEHEYMPPRKTYIHAACYTSRHIAFFVPLPQQNHPRLGWSALLMSRQP